MHHTRAAGLCAQAAQRELPPARAVGFGPEPDSVIVPMCTISWRACSSHSGRLSASSPSPPATSIALVAACVTCNCSRGIVRSKRRERYIDADTCAQRRLVAYIWEQVVPSEACSSGGASVPPRFTQFEVS